jgi:hypothetical protein
MGSAHGSSRGVQVDTFGDGVLHGTPSLGGFWGTVGGNIFFTKRLGFGAQASGKGQSGYAGIQYRPSFYSFDAIFRPARTATKRWAPEFRAVLGGAHVNYSPDDPSFGDQIAGCPSSHHFPRLRIPVIGASCWTPSPSGSANWTRFADLLGRLNEDNARPRAELAKHTTEIRVIPEAGADGKLQYVAEGKWNFWLGDGCGDRI